MKGYKLAVLLACVATVSVAKPLVQVSQGVKGGISKTVTESWTLSDDEKKNTVRMMSSINATAIAPSGTVKRREWTAVNSQHRMCYYNTYSTPVTGNYTIKMNIGGKEVNAFDSVLVAGGQAFCVTRYLEMWVNPPAAGQFDTVATTHMEMDGQATDNEGHGKITVR